MRGNLRQRAKGTWTITVELPPGPDGKRRQLFETFQGNKKEAAQRLTELLRQQDQGLPLDKSKLAVGEYLETWLRDVVTMRNRPRTQISYATIIKHHIAPVLGHISLAKLQPSDVGRMEAQVVAHKSASTAHHVHVVLSKALKDAMRKGLVARNVCQYVDPPKVGAYEVKPPDVAAVRTILEETDKTPYATAYRLIAYTGLRRGEAVALRWCNVNLEQGVLSVVEEAQRLPGKGIVFMPPKSTAGRRGIALDRRTIDLLREHRGRQMLYKVELEGAYEDNDLLFPGPLGRPLDASVLTRNFEHSTRKAGYPGVRLHDLRHFHAMTLIAAKVHPRVVQERLGHASAAFTMQVYGHVAAGLQAEAADAFATMMEKVSDKVR
ncbi:MAG: site-specific integrase [Chloroflexota bacterium]